MDRMKTAVAVQSMIMLVRHGNERGFESMVAAVVEIELDMCIAEIATLRPMLEKNTNWRPR
jgi:hypothetical protein